MLKRWQIGLAWRILFYRGNPTIQKFSIATAIGAIAVGVASLVVTLGVIDGMHQEIKNRILGLSPHVFIRLPTPKNITEAQSDWTDLEKVVQPNPGSPFALGQAMLRSSHGTLGAVIKAVDPEREKKITNVEKLVEDGEWFDQGISDAVPILIGAEAARTLSVWTGGEVALILSASSSMVASAMPRIKKARVVGIFKSGYYEYDSNMVLLPIKEAMILWNDASGDSQLSFWMGVNGKDAEHAPALAKELENKLSGSELALAVLPWSSMNQSLFSALKLEKIMLTLVLSLIIFVASVSVSSNLIMIAAQKTKMIGSLRSLGVTRLALTELMLTLGGLIGALGSALGILLSFGVIWVATHTDLVKLPAEIYMIERLPIHLQFWDVIGVVLLAWVLSLVAAAIPAYRTSRMEAGQILRYG